MPASAKILSIATADAPNVMTQTDVVRVAQADEHIIALHRVQLAQGA